MVVSKRKIRWDKTAVHYFRDAIRYIRKDSPQSADKVKNDILSIISALVNNTEIHAPDRYKLNNDGDFRAFELHRFGIAYFTKEDEIIISRIRHTSQEPEDY